MDLKTHEMRWRALLEHYGYITINWAIIERNIDNVVSLALDAGGKEIAKEHPRMLKLKIKFLKTAFSGLPFLQPWNEKAVSLLDDVLDRTDVRHDLTHGTIQALTEQLVSIDRVQYLSGYDYTVINTKINLAAIPDFAIGTAHLANSWSQFAANLLTVYGAQKP